MGAKHCTKCVYSSIKLVEAATQDIFECVNKRSVSNCFYYWPDADTTKTGCVQCMQGYIQVAAGLEGTKTRYNCQLIPTEGITKIANCSETVLEVGKTSLSGAGTYVDTGAP
jgi:hypothetical protein